MSDNREKALACKAEGNKAFASGDYKTAIEHFTKAIEFDDTDHVFFSNRSGSYAGLGDGEKALADAEKCISIKPDWPKGYTRKSCALQLLRRWDDNVQCFEDALKVLPGNEALSQQLAAAQSKKAGEEAKANNPMAKMFEGMWPKLMMNPNTRPLLDDPAFVQKMRTLEANPSMLSSMIQDPQVSMAFGALMGIDLNAMNPGANGPGGPPGGPDVSSTPTPTPTPTPAKAPEPEPEPEEEEIEVLSPEEQEEKDKKEKALAEKLLGNKAYKKKDLDTALQHYLTAIELDPKNPVFQFNKAAVQLEKKEYKDAEKTLMDAVDLAKNNFDYTNVAKGFAKLGNLFTRTKDYDNAVEYYNKSLLEHRDHKVKMALQKAEKLKKEAAAAAYLDDAKSDEAKARGNDLFRDCKWEAAIGEYTEALKRNPNNYKVYSNRAACYTKIMDFRRALDDCNACIEQEPSFVKAYIRKGKIEFFLKQYHKALETYNTGLTYDSTAGELLQGRMETVRKINEQNQSGQVDPERAKQAMNDPEIQKILRDPMMQSTLQQMQTNPQAAQQAMNNPAIRGNIEKLIAAGVLQVGGR